MTSSMCWHKTDVWLLQDQCYQQKLSSLYIMAFQSFLWGEYMNFFRYRTWQFGSVHYLSQMMQSMLTADCEAMIQGVRREQDFASCISAVLSVFLNCQKVHSKKRHRRKNLYKNMLLQPSLVIISSWLQHSVVVTLHSSHCNCVAVSVVMVTMWLCCHPPSCSLDCY